MDIDANGILSVAAKDKGSNKEQSIRIEGSGGLAPEEIDRMMKEAETHATEDQRQREHVEKRNNLDAMIYQAEKTLEESADKLSEADQAGVRGALEDAKKDLESADLAALDAARQRVEQELHKIAEVLYKSQAADSASAEGGPEPAAADEGDVVDAEYTEEKRDG